MSERSDDTLIASIPKNAREEIRVTTTVYKGTPLIGVRVWWRADADDSWKPSRKGLAFRADIAGQVISGLSKAVQGGEQ